MSATGEMVKEMSQEKCQTCKKELKTDIFGQGCVFQLFHVNANTKLYLQAMRIEKGEE
jgi:hypothetical protein